MAVIEAIETVYLEADTAYLTFSGIPATYEHLQIRMSARTLRAHYVDSILLYLGTGGGAVDTGSNYAYHNMYGESSSTVTSTALSGQSNIKVSSVAGNSAADRAAYGSIIVDILDYANANKNTTTAASGGSIGTSSSLVIFQSGLWDNTGAVTSIQVSGASASFMRGSEFTLYGLNSS